VKGPVRFQPYNYGDPIVNLYHLGGSQYDRAPGGSWSKLAKEYITGAGGHVPTICPVITRDANRGLVKCCRPMRGRGMHGAHSLLDGKRGISLVCSHHNPGNIKSGTRMKVRRRDIEHVFWPNEHIHGDVPDTPVDRQGRRLTNTWETEMKAPRQPDL